ncbi:Lipoprotein E precursor [Marinomonas spartinae]|uniref:5'-nucleotidase, lipoprotein e(P4) family n=1 Tax=Marinomonas spartinae TaxID=1792290 RepID=UPI000808C707|nr:5'-nucleotidase, lipoprotein e(P4) family [Marinomonas spartinae]SBS38440.1 Lipoprotein E precursor [Marinomonas spartinae]
MQTLKLRSFVVSTALVLGSCMVLPSWADETSSDTKALNTQIAQSPMPHEASYDTKDLNEQLVMANLWVQASGEYKALAYQAFNLAKMQLDNYLAHHKGKKRVAVIVDADETILDNSAYESWLIGKNQSYSSKTWGEWMNAAQAKAIPGSVAFLQYAAKKGVGVFYITNRKESGREGTMKNLRELGFPQVTNSHVLLRSTTSNKEPRRLEVEKHYDVALLMGDNLNDFSKDFKTKTLKQTYAAVEKDKHLFGTKFIMLPNPTYGDWEGKVYNNNWGASAAEKDKMRKAHLHAWHPKGE